MNFIRKRKLPFTSTKAMLCFNHDWWQILSNPSPVSNTMIRLFFSLLQSISLVVYIYKFSAFESTLLSWNKTNIIMIFRPFYPF